MVSFGVNFAVDKRNAFGSLNLCFMEMMDVMDALALNLMWIVKWFGFGGTCMCPIPEGYMGFG